MSVKEPDWTDELENDVTRTLYRVLARYASGDADLAEEAFEKMVRLDRRRGEIGPSFAGTQFDETVREYYHAFGTVTFDPIAVRGDRCALLRLHAALDDAKYELLAIYQSDQGGHITRSVIFDHDNLGGALDELDASYNALMTMTPE